MARDYTKKDGQAFGVKSLQAVAQIDFMLRQACPERTVYPSTVRQAHGSGRTVFPNVLSEVEGRAHASTSSA